MSRTLPLPLEDAQARLLSLATPLPVERVDIASAVGRYLAEPVFARRTQPPADLSAMDGYAVNGADLSGPWTVVGESAAGHPYSGSVAAGEAIRISTGAFMPAMAGAVILQEDIGRDGETITLTGEAPAPAGKHVRPEGMDFAAGNEILAGGIRIGPAQAALAMTAGHNHVPVRRMPRITVIDSGDELSPDCENCPPHMIPASNGTMLAALASGVPCIVDRPGPVRDDIDAITEVLQRAADADIIVTSGGASVGDHDLMRPALEAWGAQLDFWRVAIKPGKPILVATRDTGARQQIILGLPGNPVSSHVTAFLFMLPLLRALLGAASPLPRRFRSRLTAPMPATGDRREFQRAVWDGETVAALAVQDSSALAALAASNVLIDRPANSGTAQAGDEVWAYLLENGGIA